MSYLSLAATLPYYRYKEFKRDLETDRRRSGRERADSFFIQRITTQYEWEKGNVYFRI